MLNQQFHMAFSEDKVALIPVHPILRFQKDPNIIGWTIYPCIYNIYPITIYSNIFLLYHTTIPKKKPQVTWSWGRPCSPRKLSAAQAGGSIEVMKNPLNMCGFPEMVVPQNGLFTMEISIKIDDSGVPHFRTPPSIEIISNLYEKSQ